MELKKPNFKGVDSHLHDTSQFLKDVARAAPKYQFLVVTPQKGGWALMEGAFGPPLPGSNQLNTLKSDNLKKTIQIKKTHSL